MSSSAKKSRRPAMLREPSASAEAEAPAAVFETAEPAAAEIVEAPAPAFVEPTAEIAPDPFVEALPQSPAVQAAVVAAVEAPAEVVEALPEAPAVQTAVVEAAEAFVEALAEVPVAVVTAPAKREVHESVRALFEKGVVETRARYALAKTAADEAAATVEASYGAAQTGVAILNVKAMEALQDGAQAQFDLLKSLAGASTMAQWVTLQTEFARKQFETASAHAKELAELARKVADETAAPIKAHVAKTFKVAV